jgi:toxin ParE1/3/4
VTRVRFHESALAELAHEVRYYSEISPRLGEQFAVAVERAVAIASSFPEMGAPYMHGTRRAFTRRFSFSVIYLYRIAEVYILAITPDRRKPGYWRSRAAVA